MLGSYEILFIALVTWGLIGYCLYDIARDSKVAPPGDSRTGWMVMLAVGVVIWPLGWVASAAYLRARRTGLRRSP